MPGGSSRAMDRLLSFKASVSRGGVDFASYPLMEESNKSLDCALLPPLASTVIKRLLLPLALAMFNNYNDLGARGKEGGGLAGDGSRIKLRKKERAQKVGEEESRWKR